MRSLLSGLLLSLLAVASIGADPAFARPQEQTLTPQSYRRNCMMCHKTAVPEGVDPAILAGVQPSHPTRARDAMPGVTCWRRCEKCWPQPKKTRR
jgi:hypothetical protein